MMYNNKLVVAIKANGKILREFKDAVYLPYGKEYSILIKNLNSVRAVVNITIDGQNASGTGLAIEAGREIELERFLKEDLNKGNRFKFIERTSKIEKHRGVKLEDGLIRVEFQFAKQPTLYTTTTISGSYDYSPFKRFLDYPPGVRSVDPSYWQSSGLSAGSRSIDSATACNFVAASAAYAAQSTPTISETGITVEGSESKQSFVTVSDVPMLPEKHVMVVRLLGETQENDKIRNPVHVSYSPTCKTCGTKNKATNKFCVECGTALQIHS